MTPTEVLTEIKKMPVEDRAQVRNELRDEIAETELAGLEPKQRRIIESMMKKGLISKLPNRARGKIAERKIERVNVIDKPISETIIEDRADGSNAAPPPPKVGLGVAGNPDFGNDSPLYGAMGFVRKSEKKSGLTRKRKPTE